MFRIFDFSKKSPGRNGAYFLLSKRATPSGAAKINTMAKQVNKSELEALLKKATEGNQKALKKLWKKIEDLDAAIESSQRTAQKSKRIIGN